MPIKLNYKDPTSINQIQDAYGVISELHFNLDKKDIVIAYDIFRSENDYLNNVKKVDTVKIHIESVSKNAVYGEAPLISGAIAPVYGEPSVISSGYDGNGLPYYEYGEAPLISPGSPAVYGPRPLISSAVPSFGQVIFSNLNLFKEIGHQAYLIASGQAHLFKDALFIPPSGYNIR